MTTGIGVAFVLGPIFLCFSVYTYRQLTSPLLHVPGPVLARFTRLWYLSKIWRGDLERTLIDLHAKHGKVVRIAPNEFSIDDPEAVSVIYGRASSFRKSDMYQAFEVPGSPSVFTMRSIRGHTELRKKYHETYTMTSMRTYERYVDENIAIFMEKLEGMAKSENVIDMRKWLQFFAFDVIGSIATSESFGVLSSGEDRESLIQTIHDILLLSSRLSVFSELSALLHRSMDFLGRHGLVELSNVAYISHWTTQLAEKRRAELQARRDLKTTVDDDRSVPKDFMTKFVEAHLDQPDSFSWQNVVDMSIINITGGSDTISSTVSMMLFHLVENPAVVSKLRAEMRSYEEAGKLSDPVMFHETQQLEYLHAVIKESMRLGSAFGFNFARTVPDAGSQLCGFFFPSGSVVGINPYVAHHNSAIFGHDFKTFRPERWLKSETDEMTRAKMDRYFLSWGLGARTCLGRNVALMEIQKLVPQLLRKFEFEFGPELEGKTELATQNRQVMLVMNLSLRVKVHPDTA